MKKNIFKLTIVSLIFFVCGYYTSVIVNKKQEIISEKTYQDGWNDAKKRLLDTRPELFNMPSERKNLTGKINKISNNYIYIDIIPLEPLSSPDLDERVIEIDSRTLICQYAIVNSDEAYIPSGIHDPDKFTSAQKLEKRELKLSELKVGQRVTVFTDIDITEKKQFSAAEIAIES